jgi:hypothetical protein
MTIIFYDENNPDRSIPASALLFHRLVWKEQARTTVIAESDSL